jgi:hypothetical protein
MSKQPRRCKKCLGLILEAGRCNCIHTAPQPDKANAAYRRAHYYAVYGPKDELSKFRSWGVADYKRPRNPEKEERIAQIGEINRNGGFTVSKEQRPKKYNGSIPMLLFRAQVAADADRDEFANLIRKRILLWHAGLDRQKTADHLQIPRAELRWLDKLIHEKCDVRIPAQLPKDPDKVNMPRSRAGWALDVIRRYKYNFKQSQVLRPHVDSPFKGTVVS